MTAEQYGLTATIPARSIFTIDAAEKAGADYVIALSWHLVSGCSDRVYGRIFGRKNPLPNRWLRPHRERMIFY